MAEASLLRSDFYVYVLFRPDTGSPFYVGKGTRRRFETTMCGSKGSHKDRILKKARGLGQSVPRVKVASGLTEEQAFQRELALIAAIGRLPNGPLVNATDGGEGMSGHLPSEKTNNKRRMSLKGRVFSHQIGNQFAKGNHHRLSDETRKRQSEARLRVPRTKTPKMMAAQKARAIKIKQERDAGLRPKHPSLGTKIITDGVKNKAHLPGHVMPDGWRYGMTKRKRLAPS